MPIENTDVKKLPSLLEQAGNLVKQAVASGSGVLNGKPLIALQEKAEARLAICAACEFFSQGRCSKCGCFMDKKAHLEAAQCPINKWGNLQKIVSYLPVAESSVSVDTFPLEDRETILEIAAHAADAGNIFNYRNTPYISKKNANGSVTIFLHKPQLRQGPPPNRTITSDFTLEESAQFKELVQISKNTEAKVFSFKGTDYKITVDGNRLSVGLVQKSS